MRGDYESLVKHINQNISPLEKNAERNKMNIYQSRLYLAHMYGWRLDEPDIAFKEYRKIYEIRNPNGKYKAMSQKDIPQNLYSLDSCMRR